MSAQDSFDTTRQPLERGSNDIFAPLNTTQTNLQSDFVLEPPSTSSFNPIASSTAHTTEFPDTNPFSHGTTANLSNGTMNGHTSPKSTAQLSEKLTSKLDAAGTVGQGSPAPTTYYHNIIYDTFSWKYPRTTGLLFAGSLAFLLLGHFVNILRYAFKGTYITLAVISAFEYLGRPITGTGFVAQIRPTKYYTIPRAQLDNIFASLHEFTNFVVLEVQKVLYAENLSVTVAAFVLSYISYVLVKFLPVWGLVLVTDVALFTLPLAYLQNQELIEHHLHRASSAVNEQLATAQELASKHAAEATNKARAMSVDFSEKVSTAYQDTSAKVANTYQSTVQGQRQPPTSIPVAGQTAPPPPAPAPVLVEVTAIKLQDAI